MLRDHSVWSSHLHKMPLQMRACSLFTSQLFCITIISCSLTLKERISLVSIHCVSLLELSAMINLYKNNMILKKACFFVFKGFRGKRGRTGSQGFPGSKGNDTLSLKLSDYYIPVDIFPYLWGFQFVGYSCSYLFISLL